VTDCLAELAATPVATTEVVFDRGRPGVRARQSNAGNLVADAWLFAYDGYAALAGLPPRDAATVAVQNGGGIRDNAGPVLPVGGVAPGALSRKNTLDTLSFFTNLMTVVNDVSPTELEEILERSAASLPGAGGQFLQVGGIKVTYDVSEPAQVIVAGVVTNPGNRVVSAELPDGTKIIDAGLPEAGAPSVRIITNSFTAAGGDNFTTLTNLPATDRVNLGAVYESAWVEYLQSLPAGTPGGLPSRPTITGAQYPAGGSGRITIQP
jgi:2',3'-cyclic-nucleotide 2'-phosphodiesterase (5'-nucleotidase family)